MPYLLDARRKAISPIHHPKKSPVIMVYNVECAGDLNFAISTMISDYLVRKGLKYENVNSLMGALFCTALEFYARVARPYEDLKIQENGDVYDESLLTPPAPVAVPLATPKRTTPFMPKGGRFE